MYDHLDVLGADGEEHLCVCPICGGRSLYFNDHKGLWKCFKCAEGGSARKLVELLDGTYSEPEMSLSELNADLAALSADPYEPPRIIPESMLLRYSNRTATPHQHWLDRGFDKETCTKWELGFDALGENGGQLTLPYRSPATGHLDGIIFRALNPGEGPRYRFPKGFKRSLSLYGSWIPQYTSGSVSLVEGPTDAIRVSQTGRSAFSQYGSSVSTGQTRLLHRLGITSLVLFYDYDRAGLRATEKGEHLAEEFFVRKVRWSREKYCWHETVCGCPFGDTRKAIWITHTTVGNCPVKRPCKCGRVHEPDPGSLPLEEIEDMHRKAVEV